MSNTTPEKIVKTLEAKAPGKCTYCGSENLEIVLSPSPEGGVVTPYALLIWGKLNEAMPLYVIGCKNCGHIHLFAKKQLDKLSAEDDRKPE